MDATGRKDIKKEIIDLSFAGGLCSVTFKLPVIAFDGTAEDYPYIYIEQPDEKPNLTLSNVELIIGAVVPSDKERNAYINSVKNGYNYNFMSYQNYPVNTSADSTVISNLINCKLTKAKSIVSCFENLGTPTSAVEDGLANPLIAPFQPNNYHYIIDNLKTPSRNVDLRKLNRNPTQTGAYGAVHIKELVDGLKQCNKTVETLEPLKENFAISRGLSRYHHTYNFMEQRGETRLNMEFAVNSSPQLNHNFIYHWKQLTVTPEGVNVSS
jgi:hypothetical protein